MIVSRTPFRISLLGGGTDYPDAYYLLDGKVLSFSINKYSYICICKRLITSDFKTRVSYYELEKVDLVKQIKQPAVRGTLEYLNENDPLDINSISELPSQTGLGTSSSFVVGLVNCLRKRRGDFFNKEDLYGDCNFIERNVLGEKTGAQDAVAAAMGGFNTIEFSKDCIKIKPWPDSVIRPLIDHLLLMYIGGKRHSAVIASTYQFDFEKQKNMVKLVDEGRDALLAGNIGEFGQILDESWLQKKRYSKSVTTSTVDEIIEELRQMGIYGAKLCGAGSTGCIVIIAPLTLHDKIKTKFKKYSFIGVDVDWDGSKIIYNSAFGEW